MALDSGGPPNMLLEGGQPQPRGPNPEDVSKAYHQLGYTTGAIREVLMQPKVTKTSVFDMASKLVDAQVMTAQQAATQLADMPRNEEMLKPWLFMKWKALDTQMDQIGDMLSQMAPPPEQAMSMPGEMPGGPMPDQGMPVPPQPTNMLLGPR